MLQDNNSGPGPGPGPDWRTLFMIGFVVFMAYLTFQAIISVAARIHP